MGHRVIRYCIFCSAVLLITTAAWAADEPQAGKCCASAEMLVGTCVGCHGPEGNSVGPATPSIAGMSHNYFIGAMLAYKYDNDPDRIQTVIDKDPALVGGTGIRLDDVEKFERPSTIMGRLAKGYTLDEIKVMAKYFAEQKYVAHPQEVDAAKAESGAKLHDRYCEKCHAEAGSSAEDDAGILAGQWIPYLRYAMDDYLVGAREMPKKMAKNLKDMRNRKGSGSIDDLIHFYASQK